MREEADTFLCVKSQEFSGFTQPLSLISQWMLDVFQADKSVCFPPPGKAECLRGPCDEGRRISFHLAAGRKCQGFQHADLIHGGKTVGVVVLFAF